MLISFPQDIKIEEKEALLIGFHLSPPVCLCRGFFTLSIIFLHNSLDLSSDLALLFYNGLGEHCGELGFWGGHAGKAEVWCTGGARGTPMPAEQLARGPSGTGAGAGTGLCPAGSASSRPPHLPDSWHGNQTPAIFRERTHLITLNFF